MMSRICNIIAGLSYWNMARSKSSKKLKKVGNSSRLYLILCVVGLIILIALYVSRGTFKTSSQSNSELLTPSPTISKTPTLFPTISSVQYVEVPTGTISVINGYYQSYKTHDWGNTPTTCDSIVSSGDEDETILEFRRNVEAGNTLNKIINNELHINIDLSEVSEATKTLLYGSSLGKPVSVTVKKRAPTFRGVSTCYSVVDIVSVK